MNWTPPWRVAVVEFQSSSDVQLTSSALPPHTALLPRVHALWQRWCRERADGVHAHTGKRSWNAVERTTTCEIEGWREKPVLCRTCWSPELVQRFRVSFISRNPVVSPGRRSISSSAALVSTPPPKAPQRSDRGQRVGMCAWSKVCCWLL